MVSNLGPFRLVREIGSGGFAPVWLAEEAYGAKKLRDAALKLFFLPEHVPIASEDARRWREGIIEEASSLCRVEHPNIVRFYSLQQDDAMGVVGLAMEYVAGKNLDVHLHETGLFDERTAIEIGISVAWALAAVHDAGLVHRDVKPGNVIQGPSGYKLIDFGIVVPAPGAPDEQHSSVLPLAGTLGYIAPECMTLGARPTAASDLYSLGAMLHKLTTGQLPGATEGRAPGREAMAAITTLLLDPDPNARPRHADWVARELEHLRAHRTTSSPRPSSPRGMDRDPDTSSTTVTDADPAGARARLPPPLEHLRARACRAAEQEDPIEATRTLRELGLGVLRYACALGLAVVAATPACRPDSELRDQVRNFPRPLPVAWWDLLRALHRVIAKAEPAIAAHFAFAIEQPADRRGAPLADIADRAGAEAGAAWVVTLLESATGLVSAPTYIPGHEPEPGKREDSDNTSLLPDQRVTGESYALLGDRWIPLSPWLLHRGGRLLLLEAPSAPGRSWRTDDVLSGERREDPLLDEAMLRLSGDTVAAPPELDLSPRFVGRSAALALLDRAARESREGAVRFALISGPLGVGRTRLLDVAVKQAGLASGRVVHMQCSPERQSPLRPLLRALESLSRASARAFGLVQDAIERAIAPAALQGARSASEALEGVEEALVWASADAPLGIVIDDIQWGDAYTLELVRLLAERADAGGVGRLLVLAAARNEPNPSAPLRELLAQVRGRVRPGVKHIALGPLDAAETAALVQAVGAAASPDVEEAVVRGSGGMPFFAVHALSAWRELGAIAFRGGAWHAADDRVLRGDVPDVADLIEARISSYFDPAGVSGKAALRALSAVALHGGGLGAETLFHVVGEEQSLEGALDALVHAGILTVSGERQEYGFAQEMVRQAVLNLVRRRPWFFRVHRALLDTIAAGPSADVDATFLATGYEKLGDMGEARAWFERAMAAAAGAGLFLKAAELGERLVALAPDPTARAAAELDIVRALLRGRQFEAARQRLSRLPTEDRIGAGVLDRASDVRRRIYRLEVARGSREAGTVDPTLVADADVLGDPLLRCEARMALAGVAPEEAAMALVGEAVALSPLCGPAVEYAALSLRLIVNHASNRPAIDLAEEDLKRARQIASATSSPWQQIDIEGDLAIIEADFGRVDAGIDRLRGLIARAEAGGMRWLMRVLCQNLSALLLRAGRCREAALAAERAAVLAIEACDPVFRAMALSLRADALRRVGDLDAALASADEAVGLQAPREDRSVALTLLRRALIQEARGRFDQAIEDAEGAREAAERRCDRDVALGVDLLAKLLRMRSGEDCEAEMRAAIAAAEAAEAAGVALRALTRGLLARARASLEETARTPEG